MSSRGAGAPRLLYHQLFSSSCRSVKLAGQRRIQNQAGQGRETRAGKKGSKQQAEINDSDDPDMISETMDIGNRERYLSQADN
ncbi:TPA: hypothetical protein ACH3X1_007913 [Trebouxia sp. C0004]